MLGYTARVEIRRSICPWGLRARSVFRNRRWLSLSLWTLLRGKSTLANVLAGSKAQPNP